VIVEGCNVAVTEVITTVGEPVFSSCFSRAFEDDLIQISSLHREKCLWYHWLVDVVCAKQI